jgi:AP-1 complex subunit mu
VRTGGGARSRAKWLRADDVVQWKIPELPGGGEVTINVAVDVVAPTRGDARWAPPPATLSFSVPGHSATGLRVRALRVQEKSGYAVTKWVRYALVSGAYEARLV